MAADGDTENMHGTAIAVGGRAILIRGPSGAGKSDLALRAIAMPPGLLVAEQARLVADDRVIATRAPGCVRLACPAPLRGLIEVRGVGIVRVPSVDEATLALVAELAEPARVERMPEAGQAVEVLGHRVPRMVLAPFEASAPLKLLLALREMPG